MLYRFSLLVLVARVLSQRCSQPCENGGLCFESQQGYAQCFCKPPWTGVSCSEPLSPLGDSDESSNPVVSDASLDAPGVQPANAMSGINVVSRSSIPMQQDAPHDLDDQEGARAMPSNVDWTPSAAAANEAQNTQLLKSVLQHEWDIDDQIGALAKKVQSFQDVPQDVVTSLGVQGVVPSMRADGDEDAVQLVTLQPVVLQPLAPAIPVDQVNIHAVHSAMASGRSTHQIQVRKQLPSATSVGATSLAKLPSAASESPTVVMGTLVMTKPSELLSDPDSVRFSLWQAMCPDVPCKLKVYLDDIDVIDSSGSTLKFSVTPSDPEAQSEEIMLDLQGQIENKASPLYQAFPDIDPKKSSAQLGDNPMLQTPPPPTTEPPPPSKEVLGAVPEEKPPTPPPTSPGEGSASDAAAQGVADAMKNGQDPGKAAAAGVDRGKPKPVHKKSEVSPPMSTTMQCIMNLAAQFFIIATLYQFVRSYNSANGLATSRVQQILEQAKDTVQFAPMLCILFLGIRMRALQLSQNQGAPPIWVQQCMLLCAYSVLVQCLLVVCIPVLLGDGSPGEDGEPKPNLIGKIIAGLLTFIRYCCVLALYGGMTGCCVGVITMTPADALGGGKEAEKKAKEMWGNSAPPVSPALQCTMNLTVQFFAIYLVLMIVKTVHDFCHTMPWFIAMKDTFLGAEGVLKRAAETVFMAPMLCVLFIAARMRALQIDPKTGAPQAWAQMCFHICTYGMLVCTVLTLVPMFIGKKEHGAVEGEVNYKLSGAVGGIVTAARFLALLAVYAGFTVVMYSMFVIKNPNGPTPPLAPAMQCVQMLCLFFFGVYLTIFILQTIRDFTSIRMEAFWQSMQTTLATVQAAPMLCVLFVGVRMRAQEVSGGVGSPQGWAQEAMFLCVLAIAIQLAMCLLLPLIAPAPAEVDEDGNEKPRKRQGLFSKMFQGLIEVIKYLALFMLYAGVIVICFSAFVITESTANGKGHLYDEGDYSNDYFPKVPPMSTTMMCIINLTAQYFIIMSGLIILRKVNDAMEVDNAKSALVNVLEQTKDSVTFAPMLCVLFLGARMRALQLTQNEGAPQPWVQICMTVCAYAVLVQCLMVLAVGLLLGDGGEPKTPAGADAGEEVDPLLADPEAAAPSGESAADAAIRKTEEAICKAIALGLSVIRFSAMLALYGSMGAICVGILIMTPETCMPKDPERAKNMWKDTGLPPVSPALQCTMFMTIQFFAIYLLLQVLSVAMDFMKKTLVDPLKTRLIVLKMTFQQAADTVVLAPMLCILFIGTRMRALQLDPKTGAPQPWAQTLFYVCAYALLVATGLVLLNPIFATLEPGEKEDDPPSLKLSGPIAIVVTVVRFLAIACIYGAACGVLYSSLVIKAPDGKPTPPVPPAMLCVMILTIQFFVILSMIFVVDAIATYTAFKCVFMKNLLATAKVTCLFCPMMAVLFIGVRMRSNELTGGKGAPPGWVQDAMFAATGAVLIQLLLCFLAPIPVKIISVIAGLLSTIALFALYGGIVIIVAGLFMMTPEACDGKGSYAGKYLLGPLGLNKPT